MFRRGAHIIKFSAHAAPLPRYSSVVMLLEVCSSHPAPLKITFEQDVAQRYQSHGGSHMHPLRQQPNIILTALRVQKRVSKVGTHCTPFPPRLSRHFQYHPNKAIIFRYCFPQQVISLPPESNNSQMMTQQSVPFSI